MKDLPASPQELIEGLTEIFPDFVFEWDDSNPMHESVPPTPSYHAVLVDFAQFYGSKSPEATERQLKSFARLINVAVDAGDDLENAFGTCLLEHLGQAGATKRLKPFLSAAAKQRLRA